MFGSNEDDSTVLSAVSCLLVFRVAVLFLLRDVITGDMELIKDKGEDEEENVKLVSEKFGVMASSGCISDGV